MASTLRRYFRGYTSDMPFFALKRCFKLPPMGDSGIFDPKYVESIYKITFERGAVGIYIPPLPDLDFVQGNYCNLYGQRGLTYFLAFSSHVPPTNTQTPGMFYYFREHEHNVLDDLHLATKEAEATAFPTVVEAMMRRQKMLAQGPIPNTDDEMTGTSCATWGPTAWNSGKCDMETGIWYPDGVPEKSELLTEAMMRRHAMLPTGPIQGFNPYPNLSSDVDPASLSGEFCGPFSHTCTMGGHTYINQNGVLIDISPQP
jgi:hypothetical protein